MKAIKILSLVIALCMLTSVFAACGQKEAAKGTKDTTVTESTAKPTKSEANPEPEAAQPVNLRFSWWGGDSRHQATLDAIEAYTSLNSNVTIEAEYSGWDGYEQKVKTQIAGSIAPDIMQLDQPWLVDLVKNPDVLADLSNTAGMDISGFDQNFVNNFCVFDGKTVGVPTGMNARILLFNKTLAGKLGIPTDIVWTYDNVLEVGKSINDTDKSTYLLFCNLEQSQMLVNDYIKQKTGKPLVNDDWTLSFTKELATEAFAWLDTAYKTGVIAPLGECQLYVGKDDQNPIWINEKGVMAPQYSSTVLPSTATLPEGSEVDVTLMPVVNSPKSGASLVRPSQVLSIYGKSTNLDEAAKFVSWFFNDKDAAAILGGERAVPAVASSMQAALDAGKIDKNVKKAVEIGLTSQLIPDNAASTSALFGTAFSDVVQNVAYGKSTPEQAGEDLVKRYTAQAKAAAEAAK